MLLVLHPVITYLIKEFTGTMFHASRLGGARGPTIRVAAVACCGLVLCSTVVGQTTTRHQVFPDVVQAFINGLPFEDFSSEIGFRYYGAAAEAEAGDPCECTGLGTDEYILNIANGTAWSDADPDQGPGFDHALDNEVRFLFRGSGLDLLYVAHPVGENLAWEIVDGGSEGAFNAVASGSFSTFSAAAADSTAQLAAPGSLATDKLHMLRVWPQEDAGASTPKSISLDAIDVYDSRDFSIDDSLNVVAEGNPTGTWIPSLEWGDDLDRNSIPSIAGGVSRSTTDGATMTVLFNGGSLAIFGRQVAGETATFDWKIDDGGPGLEGTIDQTLDSNLANRWPHVLVNGLSHDEHSLVVTVRNDGGAGTAGALGPKPQLEGGSTEFDAISIISFADLNVAADFDIDMDVDGADLLRWQRGVGILTDATRADGDANRNRQVNNVDLAIWGIEFGNTVPAAAVAAAGVVPEPGVAALALAPLLLRCYRSRRRRLSRAAAALHR